MKFPSWLDRNLIIGLLVELAAIFLYNPVTNYFYYGGGWPFIPLFFLIIYCIGSTYIFRSKASKRLKMLLVFWWVIYVAARLLVVFIEK